MEFYRHAGGRDKYSVGSLTATRMRVSYIQRSCDCTQSPGTSGCDDQDKWQVWRAAKGAWLSGSCRADYWCVESLGTRQVAGNNGIASYPPIRQERTVRRQGSLFQQIAMTLPSSWTWVSSQIWYTLAEEEAGSLKKVSCSLSKCLM